MATLPIRVMAAEGAEVIDYPWTTAEAINVALEAIKGGFTSYLDNVMTQSMQLVVDWEGQFREDFDATIESLWTEVGYLGTDSATAVSNVVTAAENANEDQETANRQAGDRISMEEDFPAPGANYY